MIFRILMLGMVEPLGAATGFAAGSASASSSSSSSMSSKLSSSMSSGMGAKSNLKEGGGAPPPKLDNANLTKVAERMAPGNQYDLPITPGPSGTAAGCQPPNPAQTKQKICLEKAMHDKKMAIAMQQKAKQAKDCTVKLNKRSMICHTKKVMQDVVHKPKYKIEEINNIIMLKVADKVVLAEVVETLNYNVQEVSKPRETQLEDPKYAVMFNTIGGLVDQQGTPPSQTKPKNDPCTECLQQLNAQASSVEGGVDDCSYTCDDDGMQQFVNGSFFTVSKPEKKPGGEGGAPAQKPKPKGEEGA